jgi:hypothetical protein
MGQSPQAPLREINKSIEQVAQATQTVGSVDGHPSTHANPGHRR